jgi:hypothetical protein
MGIDVKTLHAKPGELTLTNGPSSQEWESPANPGRFTEPGLMTVDRYIVQRAHE